MRKRNCSLKTIIVRRFNTIKWMVLKGIKSRVNGLLGMIGLFLTDNNRLSQVLGHSDMFDGDFLRQTLGIDWSDDISSGMVMRDLVSRKIWILQGWDWEV